MQCWTERREEKGFISRDLSWLDFNARVLEEAGRNNAPLLERLKFIAIFSGNLDEFFMVRVAGLHSLRLTGRNFPDPAGFTPSQQLALIREKLLKLIGRQYRLLYDDVLPGLNRQGIVIAALPELSGAERAWADEYFHREVLPVLTPLAVDPSHPFPLLNSGAIELALELRSAGKKSARHAFIEVPDVLPRFIRLPDEGKMQRYLRLEELVSEYAAELFPGCIIAEKLLFRIIRDMDFSVENEATDDLPHTIRTQLLQCRQRDPIRLEIAGALSPMAEYLRCQLRLSEEFVYAVPGMLHLKQLAELIAQVNRPDLLEDAWPPIVPAPFRQCASVFEAIDRAGTILLAPPYHSFDPVVRFLEEAADDPDVLAIKQTLYRVSGNSPVVRALQRAAENGKQVAVLVELKARFDESRNIAWAELLDRSGAHVVYGIPGLKVHSKVLMVVRRSKSGIRRYVHFGTGNYNDKTAQSYTDMGIFSNAPELCADAAELFNLLTGGSVPPEKWNAVAVAPFDLRGRLTALIERETALGKKGRIIAKMNSFSDPDMVRLIHRAADAGVQIDLIVRGICCYRPLPHQENCRIISIVDRYLEHSRIFYFGNDGAGELFLASADWMTRNLERRIETMFPVGDAKLKKVILDVLNLELNDRCKAHRLGSGGIYRCAAEPEPNSRSQAAIYRYFQKSI